MRGSSSSSERWRLGADHLPLAWLVGVTLSSVVISQPSAHAQQTASEAKIETTPAPVATVFDAVDDRALKQRFEVQLSALKSEGKTVDPATLRQQLKRTRVQGIKFATAPDQVLQAAAVYDEARSGTLLFGHLYKCDKCDRWHGGIAGGVVLTADGVAVTNYHVIDNDKAAAFGAMTAGGSVHPVTEVLAASKKDDVALVRLGGSGFDPVMISLGDPVGSEVRVVSHPDGRFYTYSEGVVARYFTDRKNGAPRMQITADYARGSSGSGVFNQGGALTGLVSATTSIYYEQSKEHKDNLQMVVKSCIPVAAIWKLVSEEE